MPCQLSVGFPINQTGTGSRPSLPKGWQRPSCTRGTYSSCHFVRCGSARSLKLHSSELKRLSQGGRDGPFLSQDKGRQHTSSYVGMRQCITHQPEWSSCVTDKKKDPAEKHYSANKTGIWDSVWISRLTEAGREVMYLIIEKPRQGWFSCGPARLSPRSCVWAAEGGERGGSVPGPTGTLHPSATDPLDGACMYKRCPEKLALLQSTTTHTIGQLFREMQFCMMVSTSPHQHPHYRNCCWFALAPACSDWSQNLQAAAADANKPATATVSTISPGASHPPPGCHFWFCSPLAQAICIRCPCRVRTQPSFLSQDFAHSESKLLPVSW